MQQSNSNPTPSDRKWSNLMTIKQILINSQERDPLPDDHLGELLALLQTFTNQKLEVN